MFNVGGPEIVVILMVALLVLGPEQLPKAMRTFGNVMAEIRKVSSGFQDEMRKAMDTIETTVAIPTDDKPMSEKPPSGAPGETAATMGDADTTETIVGDTGGPGSSPEPVATAESGGPVVDPADRAAG
ncbi:MAG: tatB [Acidimicrobiales bacterium]|nr:tatB [Acidimicrobiales bacterium]